MDKKTFDSNIAYLASRGLALSSTPIWSDKPFSVELEGYTDAGGDMAVCLEEPSREALRKYINDFDIDGEVDLWWTGGQPGNGVPFATQEEHRQDLRRWLDDLRDICDVWPGEGGVNATYDVMFSPMVNVKAKVADPGHLTEEEREAVIEKAVERVRALFDDVVCGENVESVSLRSTVAEDGTEMPFACDARRKGFHNLAASMCFAEDRRLLDKGLTDRGVEREKAVALSYQCMQAARDAVEYTICKALGII